jgi:hypothetical protein
VWRLQTWDVVRLAVRLLRSENLTVASGKVEDLDEVGFMTAYLFFFFLIPHYIPQYKTKVP